MRTLITGAAGFVGSHVVRAVLENGGDVVALVRPGSNADRLTAVRERVTIREADLDDVPALDRVLSELRPSRCIHLAWYAEPGVYLHSPENERCRTRSLELIRRLAAFGCGHVVMAGTCAEYAESVSPLREDSPLGPATPYAEAKARLSIEGADSAVRSGLAFAWGRLFFLYGPGEDGRRLVPTALRRATAGEPMAVHGDRVRDFLHVTDVAAGLECLSRTGTTGAVNISSGEGVSIRRVVETVESVVGTRGTYRENSSPPSGWNPTSIVGDNRRLRGLGWRANYGLETGIRDTFERM